MDNSSILVTCILSSTVAAALVNALKELILWRMNRKAATEDKIESKEDKIEDISKNITEMQSQIERLTEICTTLEEKLGVTSKANKLILQDRIKVLVFSYAQEGEIAYEDRKLVHEMWDIYHHGLGGNGDLDDVLEVLDQLPLKIK